MKVVYRGKYLAAAPAFKSLGSGVPSPSLYYDVMSWLSRRIASGLALPLMFVATTIGVASAAPGELDQTFDGDGVVDVEAPPGLNNFETLAASAPGGGLWVGRSVKIGETSTGPVAITRLLDNGALDTAFAKNGTALFSLRGSATWNLIRSVASAPRGGVRITGLSIRDGRAVRIFVAQFSKRGELDESFGEHGVTSWRFRRTDTGIGTPFVAEVPDGAQYVCAMNYGARRAHVWRVLSDGTLDPNYGSDGEVLVINRRGAFTFQGCGLTSDGQLSLTVTDDDPNIVDIIRLTAEGTLDLDYGNGGYVFRRMPKHVFAWTPAYFPDGSVALGGLMFIEDEAEQFPAVLKLASDGSIDTTYGGGDGVAVNDAPQLAGLRSPPVIATKARGDVVIAGGTAWIAKFTRTGDVDHAFGGFGGVVNFFPQPDATPTAALFDSSGKIVVASIPGLQHTPAEVARFLVSPQ